MRSNITIEIEHDLDGEETCFPCERVRGIIPKCQIYGRFLKCDEAGRSARIDECLAAAVAIEDPTDA